MVTVVLLDTVKSIVHSDHLSLDAHESFMERMNDAMFILIVPRF